MVKINENYGKLPGSYLFSEVARRISAYTAAHPEAKIIKLSIGDVTRPLVPAVTEAMHKAVDEMGTYEGFHGYGPEQGYDFLRQAIAQLPDRERQVILLRYYRNMTQERIARIVGVSQVQVSRIERRAVEQLRAWLK